MSSLTDHPTVQRFYQQPPLPPPTRLKADWLKQLCLDCGADDAGVVEIERAEIQDQRAAIEEVLPGTRALISLVIRTRRDNIRAPLRSISNLEFHEATGELNAAARRIVAKLEELGVRAVNPPGGFPMEMDRWGSGKIWAISHKPVAVAAGLGQMGIHRNVIHPRFGNFILLDTIAIDAEVTAAGAPIVYNPCLECKLCVAVCPVGAIAPDGGFDFSACFTHNYREFMGGFTDWVETVASSGSGADYRDRVPDSETASLWQSLSFGPNYKSAYCIAVCPAGEEVISPFLTDRKVFLDRNVRPLQARVEPVYVSAGSDAEAHVQRRFPHKQVRRVGHGIRPRTIPAFLRGLPLVFQRNRAAGLNAVYHFRFTGTDACEVTITIRDRQLQILDGCIGDADLKVTVDSRTWLDSLTRKRALVTGLLRGKLRLSGSPRLLLAFGRCFGS